MASQWAWRAGEMFFDNPNNAVCRHRIAKLGMEMMAAGEKFTVVTASKDPKAERHTWIEYNDEILEPTTRGTQEQNFPYIDHRVSVNSGNAVDDLSFLGRVQRMYDEIGEKLPEKWQELFDKKRGEYMRGYWANKMNLKK